MRSLYHFLASLIFCVWGILGQEPMSVSLLCILVGWLVDADHEIDYFIFTKSFVIDPLKLGNELSHRRDKMYLPLHGWEILFLIMVGCLLFHLSFLVVATYFCHLIMDIVGNDISALNMSILRRWSRGWKRG